MNTQTGIAVALAVAVALIFLFFGGSVLGLFFQSSSTSVNQIDETTMSQNSTLQIADTVVGTGEMAEAGDTVSVHYVGVFQDGTVFDASANHGGPFSFVLGAGSVIKGWDQGLLGMKVGGKRVLTVPPELGYGPNDYGPIPGNSTLLFEVELVDVVKAQ